MTASLVLVANAGDGTITSFRLSGDSLTLLATAHGLTGCSNFVVDPSRDLVHAAVKGDPSGIVTLALDRDSGVLTQISRRDLQGGGLNYVALTRGGSALLGVSYGGGYGISAPVGQGGVGEPVTRISYPNLHSVLPSEDGKFAYFVSLGADLVAQYAIQDDLSLAPLSPATVAAPSGSGPRHLVLNEAQNAVYVLTEFSGEVLHFSRDRTSGVLALRSSPAAFDTSAGLGHGRIGVDPRPNHLIWGADLHLGTGGRTLWASERTESTLGALSVAADGTLAPPRRFTATETQPRGFALSTDGRHLVAAGEESTTVSVYTVDEDDLRLSQRVQTGHGANWVRFV
ncbi:6-phosphogluconolactonase [Cryobacterium frigoriphilum]|uniref:6-phosphogluconolactonase n=1 Tax=Cryobacterium frigoriphilum TaxID=1259150 RepID=A0A4R8ZVA8_9MICO|nr:beta-propeller fold lactonase family protein [Cryobacterium frigoriphilum]TFD46971.1 6-phosphogluconolactonase [Cryobacterium frigoriphilum]